MDKLTLTSLAQHQPRRALSLRENAHTLLLCPACTLRHLPTLRGLAVTQWDGVSLAADPGRSRWCFMCETPLEFA